MDILQHPRLQRRRVERYLVFRFVIILMTLGLVAVYQMGIEPDQKEPMFQFLYTILGIYLVAGLVSLASTSRWARARWFITVQVSIDFVMGSLLTASTGGVSSIFCPILFVILFSACNVVGLRGALIFAALATTLLTITTLGLLAKYLPGSWFDTTWSFKERQFNFELTYLFAVGIALLVVAILGSQISTGLLRVQSLQHEILENMCEGLIAVDGDGNILLVNTEAKKIIGIDPDTLAVGEPLDRMSGESFAPIRAAFAREGGWRREMDLDLPDGRTRCLDVKVSDTRDERGKLRCRVGLFTDLALKKEMEEAERRILQLEELYEMSLGIAHEIRNPLASIRGCIQEIGRMKTETTNCSRLVEIVCRESDRLDRIIEEFMSYTRKSSRPTDPIELAGVVEETVILLRNHPRYQNRQLDFERPDEEVVILGDRERLRQVLLNLGLNALASTRPDSGLVRTSLRRRDFFQKHGDSVKGDRQTSGVEIVFEDNGVGIPRENLDKIFTPFFTSKETGSGLGLAICHRIVHDHGGTIQVKSQEGKGTVFSVLFPVHRTWETAHDDASVVVPELEVTL